jgi:hypothetical protein
MGGPSNTVQQDVLFGLLGLRHSENFVSCVGLLQLV